MRKPSAALEVSARPASEDWGLEMANTHKHSSTLGVWGLVRGSAVESPFWVAADLWLTADKPEMVCRHCDFRGEMKVALLNAGHELFNVAHGDRVAQAVIAPILRPSLVEVAVLSET